MNVTAFALANNCTKNSLARGRPTELVISFDGGSMECTAISEQYGIIQKEEHESLKHIVEFLL